MKTAIFEKDYEVNSFVANTSKRLGLLGLVGILQDMALCHAHVMGFGHEKMLELGSFWVLTRQSVTMKKWPELFTTIKVKTWSRRPQSFYAFRDFEIYLGDELIGHSTTTWVTLDIHSRKPSPLPLDRLPFTPREEGILDYEAKKIKCDGGNTESMKEFKARNSDLDLNSHVNNTKYCQWILDSIPYELHKNFELENYHINFLAEVKLDETVVVSKDLSDSIEGEKSVFIGQGENPKKPSFLVELNYHKIF